MNYRKKHGKTKPTDLPRRRVAKQCKRCASWFSVPRSESHRYSHCSTDCTTAPAVGGTLEARWRARERADEVWAREVMGVALTYRELA